MIYFLGYIALAVIVVAIFPKRWLTIAFPIGLAILAAPSGMHEFNAMVALALFVLLFGVLEVRRRLSRKGVSTPPPSHT